jgi:hypothetical protein
MSLQHIVIRISVLFTIATSCKQGILGYWEHPFFYVWWTKLIGSRVIAISFVWIRLWNYKEWYKNMKDGYRYRLNSQNSDFPIFCCLAYLPYSGEGSVSSGRVPTDVSSTVSFYNTVTTVDSKRMNTRTLIRGRSSHQDAEHADLTSAAVQCERQEVV